tara:strand:+ start:2143 stop:2445 length:303 start_codon:yes stop_codon:yes gene_type:complete
MNVTDKYIRRRTGIIEDKLNELFSPELNYYMDIYLDYSIESFLNLIVLLLQAEVSKDIPLTNVDSKFFSNIDLYGKIGEDIKNKYQLRIMDYYNSRKTYL